MTKPLTDEERREIEGACKAHIEVSPLADMRVVDWSMPGFGFYYADPARIAAYVRKKVEERTKHLLEEHGIADLSHVQDINLEGNYILAFGERCSEFQPDCPLCDAWKAYDAGIAVKVEEEREACAEIYKNEAARLGSQIEKWKAANDKYAVDVCDATMLTVAKLEAAIRARGGK